MVRKGYKQTEVGVIPEDWEVKRLIDVVNYVDYRGKTPSKQESGVVLVTARNIKNGYIDYELSQEYVSVDQYEKIMSRGKPIIGDVLITTEAPLGNVASVDVEYIALAQRVIKYRGKDSNLKQAYLKYYLLSEKFQEILHNHSSGSTAQGIKGSVLHKLPIIITKPQEQQAIATTLSDVDTLITTLEKVITKKKAIKTATMQQLLTGKTRLPGFDEGKGYKQTEVGVIPEDWDVKELADVLKIKHGKSQHEVISPGGAYPILATGGEIGRTNTPLYSKPSVLIGRKGTINIPKYMETPFWTVDTLFYSEITETADAKFIFYKFSLIDWYTYNEASGVPSLNAATIERIKQSFPKLKKEQTAIATTLSDIDTEIFRLESRLTKSKSIKKGMMQELLTGRTRLV